MSQGHDGLGYSVWRIFLILFFLTGAEVAWGMMLHSQPHWILWGGLIAFALAKGLLIFMYFMHMKFERFLIWSLILPTPLLIMVVLFALMPDLSFNDRRDYAVGRSLAPDGQVVDMVTNPLSHEADSGHDAGAKEHAGH
jgi:cytochrome c oxidase subunit IV